jgi:hypothetical protein
MGWQAADMTQVWVTWAESIRYGVALGLVAIVIALAVAWLWHGDR